MSTLFERAKAYKPAAGIVAIARAHCTMPGFDIARAVELATRLETAIDGARTMETVYALCMLLLKGIGVADAKDIIRADRN